jgi:uncharacterized lipoprotein YajG
MPRLAQQRTETRPHAPDEPAPNLKGMYMKMLSALAGLTLLAGCATVLTPQRCEQAAAGLSTAAAIAQVLIDHGIEAAKARKLAEAVATGQMLLAAACAEAPPPPVGM